MHRSGTSALTRVLNILGADVPKNLLAGYSDNPTGHWESHDLVALHDQLLTSVGSIWHDWRKFNSDWFDSPSAQLFKDRILAVLRNDFAASRLFVIKDPRICRFWPFWHDILGEFGAKPAILMPVRNPLEVAASLKQRDGFIPAKSCLLWLRHVLDAERATRGLPRVVTLYEALIDDWQTVVSETSQCLGLRWPRGGALVKLEVEEFLSAEYRHQSVASEELATNRDIAEWVRETYAVLSGMTENPNRPSDFARLDQIQEAFDQASAMFGTVLAVHETQLEKRAEDLRKLSGDLQQLSREAARLRNEYAASEEGRKAVEAELAKARAQIADGEVRLNARFEEIATLSRLFRENEITAAQVEWIKKTTATLLIGERGIGERILMALPNFVVRAWIMRQLKEKRLFDSQAYLRANPDVARAGADPLRHYINHGITEGRDLG